MKRLLSGLCVLWLLGSMACYLDRNVQCEADRDCLGGATCQNNRCSCPGNQTFCNEGKPTIVCADLLTDSNHCGSCGRTCATGERCDSGNCISCDATKGDVLCGGACVNTDTSVKHCGGCNNECKGGRQCNKGKCECPPDFSLCSEACVNLQTSTTHCGTCDKPCASGESCNAGKCVACADANKCGDECPDFKTDKNHCGGCNQKCKDSDTCCDGTCVDTQTDTKNCGSCGTACSGPSCKAGVCECDQGKTSCSGACVDLKADAKNCGTCGTACPSGQDCKSGVCCKSGAENCGGACVDQQTDPSHCGACDNACPAGQLCSSGTCKPCQQDSECGSGLTCDNGSCVCGPKCSWVSTLGAKNADVVGYGIAVDKDGNVFVTGRVQDELSYEKGGNKIVLKANGGGDIFVAKMNARGQLEWVKRFGGNGPDEGRAITVDNKGGIFLTGSFSNKVTFEAGKELTAAQQATDIFVLALDGKGAVTWVKRAGGEGTDEGLGIAYDNKDGVVVTGRFAKLAAFGATSLPPGGTASTNSKELFLTRLATSNGDFSWALAPTGSSGTDLGGAVGNSVAVSSQGSFFVTGSCENTIKVGGEDICTTGNDFLILEAKSDGSSFVAGKASKGSAQGNGIIVDGSGLPHVAGYFQSSVLFEKGYNAQGALDVFVHVFKTPLDYNTTFQVKAGSSGEGEAKGIATTSSAKVIAGFYKAEITFDSSKLASQGANDIFVAGLDNAGKWTWSLTAGGSQEDKAHAIATDGRGGVYVVGGFQGTVKNFQTDATADQTAQGKQDLFVWKVPVP